MFGVKNKRGCLEAKLMALDMVRAKIMIADDDLNIVYMNPAVSALMREAEADLKKELPRFSVATLVGSNIDIFHKDPTHQRRMLAGLEKQHSATIKVGTHMFDLLVSPLREGSTRLGYVVEWADAKERLLNFDYAAQLQSIARSQAVISFKPDGTILDANENFLHTVGYSLDEVIGQNHSMFVAADHRNSDDYRAFWDKLRKGEYQAAQFRRIAKSGKSIWIEGAYNPIFDEQGRIVKVIKFANDVTAQVSLLTNLKTLLDINFGEIDGAIASSNNEALSAARAAEETSGNLQMVAASAEQLAASIAEISQSMAKSRTATVAASAQAARNYPPP